MSIAKCNALIPIQILASTPDPALWDARVIVLLARRKKMRKHEWKMCREFPR